MNSLYLWFVGAGVLFVVGYTAHAMYGNNNVIEEVVEDMLNKEYHIDVEFSQDKPDGMTDKCLTKIPKEADPFKEKLKGMLNDLWQDVDLCAKNESMSQLAHDEITMRIKDILRLLHD